MINHHFLKIFRDFPRFSNIVRIFLGSSGTYPGVQNRSLGATFQNFRNLQNGPKSVWKGPGGSQESPGPHTKIWISPEILHFLNIFFYCLLNCLLYCLLYCLLNCLLNCLSVLHLLQNTSCCRNQIWGPRDQRGQGSWAGPAYTINKLDSDKDVNIILLRDLTVIRMLI